MSPIEISHDREALTQARAEVAAAYLGGIVHISDFFLDAAGIQSAIRERIPRGVLDVFAPDPFNNNLITCEYCGDHVWCKTVNELVGWTNSEDVVVRSRRNPKPFIPAFPEIVPASVLHGNVVSLTIAKIDIHALSDHADSQRAQAVADRVLSFKDTFGIDPGIFEMP